MSWNLPPVYDEPSITADGSAVHAVDEARTLRAWDAATGSVRWTAGPPPSGRWNREDSYADGVLATFGDDQRSVGICRLDRSGARRWCTTLDRPLYDVGIGGSGGGLWVETAGRDAAVLDPDTGERLGDWVPGGEVHLYFDLSQPHDTRFVPSLEVLDRVGGTTVVVNARTASVDGWRGRERVWTHPLSDASVMTVGGAGGVMVFAHRTAPEVTAAGRVFQVGSELLALTPEGGLKWWRTAPEGRLVTLGGSTLLVTASDVRRIDPDTGAERWRTAVDGLPAVVGERAELGYVEPDAPRDVVWVDPDTGRVSARTPLGGRVGSITATRGGLLAITGEGDEARWSMLAPDGTERWSTTASFMAEGDIGFRYDTERWVDLESGRDLGPAGGTPVSQAGAVWIVYDDATYTVTSAP